MRRCPNCDARLASEKWQCPNCQWTAVEDGHIPVLAPDLAREIGGYEAALFETHGGDQAERSFWTPARAALIVWALEKYAPGARRFLEIGCGTGGVLVRLEQAFPAMELTGAEALVAGLHRAAKRVPRARLLQCDGARIPFESEFDVVGAFDVIEHIRDDDKVLGSMAASLRPGGVLILTVPQHPFLFGPADVSARHERRYTAAGLAKQVSDAGLRVECLTSFVSLLFPAMAAVRMLAKVRAGSYDSADEFKIGPFNNLFAGVMDVERWTIRAGMRWPFGGSLLLVARRTSA